MSGNDGECNSLPLDSGRQPRKKIMSIRGKTNRHSEKPTRNDGAKYYTNNSKRRNGWPESSWGWEASEGPSEKSSSGAGGGAAAGIGAGASAGAGTGVTSVWVTPGAATGAKRERWGPIIIRDMCVDEHAACGFRVGCFSRQEKNYVTHQMRKL